MVINSIMSRSYNMDHRFFCANRLGGLKYNTEFKSQLRRTLANSANYMSIGVVNE